MINHPLRSKAWRVSLGAWRTFEPFPLCPTPGAAPNIQGAHSYIIFLENKPCPVFLSAKQVRVIWLAAAFIRGYKNIVSNSCGTCQHLFSRRRISFLKCWLSKTLRLSCLVSCSFRERYCASFCCKSGRTFLRQWDYYSKNFLLVKYFFSYYSEPAGRRLPASPGPEPGLCPGGDPLARAGAAMQQTASPFPPAFPAALSLGN